MPGADSDVARALAAAKRLTTPCGDGDMVWHAWGNALSPQPPLVLLHGGSGSWTHWVRNVEALAASGRYVLAADLPGFGDSVRPPVGDDADALPAPLQQALNELIGPEPCDLVGFSFGGMTAGLMAAAFPERVARLFIVGAPGLGLASRRTQGLQAWRHLPDLAAQREIHRCNLAALMLLHPESIDEQALDIQASNLPRDRMPGRFLAFTPALAEALSRVRCPVHVIYGAGDALYKGRMEELEQRIRASSPTLQSLQFIPDAGHWVQYERAEVFNRTLLDLLG